MSGDGAPVAGDAPRIKELFVYLCVHDAEAAIAFYAGVFGARETFRLAEPGGRVATPSTSPGSATRSATSGCWATSSSR